MDEMDVENNGDQDGEEDDGDGDGDGDMDDDANMEEFEGLEAGDLAGAPAGAKKRKA